MHASRKLEPKSEGFPNHHQILRTHLFLFLATHLSVDELEEGVARNTEHHDETEHGERHRRDANDLQRQVQLGEQHFGRVVTQHGSLKAGQDIYMSIEHVAVDSFFTAMH